MTWLLMVAFVILFSLLGYGFDISLGSANGTRFISVPALILMIGSFMWTIHRQYLNVRSSMSIEDEDDELKDIKRYDWFINRGGLVLTAFAIAFFIGFCIMYYYDFAFFSGKRPAGVTIDNFLVGTLIACISGTIIAISSLFWSKFALLWSLNAAYANPNELKESQLINVVKEMSLAAGIPTPSVCIVQDSDPNAMAVGISSKNSTVIITQGLLNILDREELQGVVAHEISHIKNLDMRLMTLVAALIGSIVLLCDWGRAGFLLQRTQSIPKIFIIRGMTRIFSLITWILTLLFAPVIARLIALGISRNREYLADASGAALTRNPDSLARALQKIENVSGPTETMKRGVAHLCIVDPQGKKVNEKEGWWADLFAMHPPMKKRIILLKSMAYQRI
jgi:heat shock protein HtpX